MAKRSNQQNKEEWKPVKGYEGFYEISNHGRVKSLSRKQSRTERIMKNTVNHTGYEQVALNKYCAFDAVRDEGFNSSGISRCCNGVNHTHKGFKWKFANE